MLNQLVSELTRIEQAFVDSLEAYRHERTEFSFRIEPLQDANSGIVAQGVEETDHGPEVTQDPHITRYYAVLVRRTETASPAPRTLDELRRNS